MLPGQMKAVRTRLPCELTSNLVFSSDAQMLFGLSARGDLVSLKVPFAPGEAPDPPSILSAAEHGAFVAAGWLEGRLATITVKGVELALSHGFPGDCGAAPSTPVSFPL